MSYPLLSLPDQVKQYCILPFLDENDKMLLRLGLCHYKNKYSGDWNKLLLDIIKYKNIGLVQYCLNNGANNFEEGLIIASKYGLRKMIDIFISKGVDNLDDGIGWASANKHFHLVHFFIKKGVVDWNNALIGAVTSGHFKSICFFIKKGADNFDEGMCAAAYYGYLDLVNFFISKGANKFCSGLKHAASGGHLDIVEFFYSLKKRAIKLDVFRDAFRNAVINNHPHIINFFIKHRSSVRNYGFEKACEGGHISLVEYFINHEASVDNGVYLAVKYGHLDILNFLIYKGVTYRSLFWAQYNMNSTTEIRNILKLVLEGQYTVPTKFDIPPIDWE